MARRPRSEDDVSRNVRDQPRIYDVNRILSASMEDAPTLPGPHFGLGYRICVLVAFLALFSGLFFLHDSIWGVGRAPSTFWEQIVWWLSFAWVLPMPGAMMNLIGMVMYRRPLNKPINGRCDVLVSFRIVTRGQDSATVRATVRNVRREMAKTPLFPYRIEIVTDAFVDLAGDQSPDVVQLVVPPTYETSNGSLYKARALHYALEASDVPDGAWLMHLDEESHISRSLVVGIRSAVLEEERAGTHRIGQGAILYHRHLGEKLFLTLADSVRTGDDVGRYHFQQRMGITLFGLHGSFILVRNSVEKEVGFDFGLIGSITEDAYWALRQMENGRRSRWVDGYLVEQGTQTVPDFIKQRRRWFVGLILVSLGSPVSIRYRIALALSTIAWSAAWIGILPTYLNFSTGVATPLWVQLGGNAVLATYVVTYVLGLKINLDHHRRVGWRRAALLYTLQVVLIPVFQVIEGAGTLSGLLKPGLGFHVIQKDMAPAAARAGK